MNLLINLSLDNLPVVKENYRRLLVSTFVDEEMLWKAEEEYTKLLFKGFLWKGEDFPA